MPEGARVSPFEKIHPDVLAASFEELIAAGWGWVTRQNIPADWRDRPLPANTKGGRKALYRTPEERVEAARGWRRKYDEKRRKVTPQARATNTLKVRKWRVKSGRFPGREETPALRAEILQKARAARGTRAALQ